MHRAAAVQIQQRVQPPPRRWSMPAQAMSSLLNLSPAPVPVPAQLPPAIPGLPPRRLSLDNISVQAYTQPSWVVHSLPAVAEESMETKAERTSRHLRETSAGRGRSTSPPSAPVPVTPIISSAPHLRRPPSVAGPRPAPRRSASTLPSAPSTQSAPVVAQPITPPLLSPMPQPIEPNSYFDQQVHSLCPDSPIGHGKLSPATIKSLEDFAESLATPPRIDKTLPGSPDEIRSKAMRPLGSPLRERRSVMSVFDIDAPRNGSGESRLEATRRESSERRVAVETRRVREASIVVEIHNEASVSLRPGPQDYLERILIAALGDTGRSALAEHDSRSEVAFFEPDEHHPTRAPELC